MPSAPPQPHRPPGAERTMSAPGNAPPANRRWAEDAACQGLPTSMFFHPHQEPRCSSTPNKNADPTAGNARTTPSRSAGGAR